MEFGITLPSHPDSWKAAKRAEELGFAEAWFYDSQLLYTDVFVAMTLAAEHTERIRLGTGVLVPTNRIAPVTAGCFASLNQLAPGRIDFGVGTGYTARLTMGLGPQRWADFTKYIADVQAIVSGGTTDLLIEGEVRPVRFLHPGRGYVNLADPVQVHVSAFGPRGRAFTAKHADGWIGVGARGNAAAALVEVGDACKQAGRDPATLRRTVFDWGCLVREGEAFDSPRVKAVAGPLVTTGLHGEVERLTQGGGAPATGSIAADYWAMAQTYPARSRYLDLHTGHMVMVRPDEERFVTAETLRRTFTGTAAELRDHLRDLKGAGATQFAIQIIPGQHDTIDEWARLFDTV